jgi:catechol 2,3-dioxygenase
MMDLPRTDYDVPFNITRTSHVVLTVKDLAASRLFYTDVIGLVVTAEEGDMLYLRGIEEACHHSLVLRRSREAAACARIGMRVLRERDLDRLKSFLESKGCTTEWADVRHQGRTLYASDAVGVPLEFCASMPVVPRMITQFHLHKGGAAARIDHYQILVPDVRKATEFYMSAGFWLSEYIAPGQGDELAGVFLQRKGNPHDIVFFTGAGPRLHHAAFTSPESTNILRACDVAGTLGFGACVERGPGRHGPGHAFFTYFRDPDGHRVELFNTHYQAMDIEVEPVRWDPGDGTKLNPWGLPAQKSWFMQATPFAHVPQNDPPRAPNPMTLERFLAAQES